VAPVWTVAARVGVRSLWVIAFGATFRAHFIGTSNPGLKPWAESLCPFGADSGSMFMFTRTKNKVLELSKMKSPSLGNREEDNRYYQKNEN
jgi:hypothetical protein